MLVTEKDSGNEDWEIKEQCHKVIKHVELPVLTD